MRVYRPLPLDIAIKVSPRALYISKTDIHGNIVYVNQNMQKLSAYLEDELLGLPHNILRHPNMPRVIFYKLWSELEKGNEVTLLIKNLAKTGEFYWLKHKFQVIENDLNAKYSSRGEMASSQAIEQLETLYKKLLKIEKRENMAASLFYLENYLQERNLSFSEYMEKKLTPQPKMGLLFKKIKNSLITAA